MVQNRTMQLVDLEDYCAYRKRSYMKKEILTFLFVILLLLNSYGQRDSVRNSVTTNLIAGVLFQEVGLYYNIKLSSHTLIELSYAHRFRNLTIIKNGGSGGEYKLWKQTGDIIRVGFKTYFQADYQFSNYTPYNYFRMSYWNLHTPKYTTREGPNGYNTSLREVISVDKNLINLALGLGKSEQIDEHLFMDFFFAVGLSVGSKRIHKYSYDKSGNGTAILYPDNTIEKTFSILPTIELGFNIGYFW